MDVCNLDEYLAIVDIIHNYDTTLLTIKGWGVTLSLAAIGYGFKEKVKGYFLLAVISGIAFWAVEYSMKGYQMQYYPRMRAIEVLYHNSDECNYAPKIDYSWDISKDILENAKTDAEKEAINSAPVLRGEYEYYGWYGRLKTVAIPHMFSVIFGLLFAGLAFFKIRGYRDYD